MTFVNEQRNSERSYTKKAIRTTLRRKLNNKGQLLVQKHKRKF